MRMDPHGEDTDLIPEYCDHRMFYKVLNIFFYMVL